MTDELLAPCPFCGCEIHANRFCDTHAVTCFFVAQQVLDEKDIQLVNIAWDNRPIEDALRARIAELEAALRGIDGVYQSIDYPPSDSSKLAKVWLIARRALERDA